MKKYFGEEYFLTKQNPKVQNIKIDESNWLKFLLSNNQKAYTEAAIEFCQVLETFDNTQFEKYLWSKLKTKKGKVHPKLFKGFYHELFTAFIFKVNNLEYFPDLKGDNTEYDGFTRFTGQSAIVECKEVLADDKIKRIHDLTFNMNKILEEYAKRNLIITRGNKKPLIVGYFRIYGDTKNAIDEFKNQMQEFEKTNSLEPLIRQVKSGELCIEIYKEGLFENYTFPRKETVVKFKTEFDSAKVEVSMPDEADKIIDRIREKGIRKKMKQHDEQPYEIKILSIGLTAYPFTRFFKPNIIENNLSRILPLLKEDTIAFFIIRNFLDHENYHIQIKAIGHERFDNAKKILESIQLKFIEYN